MYSITVQTAQRKEMKLITGELAELVAEHGWQNGALLLFCPHTTAALTVNEAADPDVAQDMCSFMSRLVPPLREFRHAEGNSDAHIQSSLFGPHCMLVLEKGRIQLGTWQGVYFCEWDGPRKRQIWVEFLPGA